MVERRSVGVAIFRWWALCVLFASCSSAESTMHVLADVTTDVSSDIPSIPSDAPSDVPSIPSDAPSDVPSIPSDAPTDGTESADSGETQPNSCGGQRVLMHMGVEAELGVPCGDFGEGIIVCASLETVVCAGQSERNACGGRGVLPVTLGEPCGPCGEGVWTCTSSTEPQCLGAREPNGCGGCAHLTGRPGSVCSAEETQGTWVCASRDLLTCQIGDSNPCGGTGMLSWERVAASPGETCDTRCGVADGVLACEGAEALTCVPTPRALPENICGGCGALPGRPDDTCGGCGVGVWQCADDDGEMMCEGTVRLDACGGCGESTNRPGTFCDDGRVWTCDGPALVCASPVDVSLRNACGGTARFENDPGSACGACGDGVWGCATRDQLRCIDAIVNPCGGCGTTPGQPGHACGVCGTGELLCAGTLLACEGDEGPTARSACGGCGELGAHPGEACGSCLSWTCTEMGALRCEADTDLDGCDDLVTCETLQCDLGYRTCEASDGASDASCGACLTGYLDVMGSCVAQEPAVRSCGDAGCAAQNRTCIQPNERTDATCGACLEGLEEVGSACASSLPAPVGVTASQGTNATRVEVTWDPVPDADGYHVYRDGERITSSPVESTGHADASAPSGGVPDEILGISATTNRYNDVVVSWNEASSPPGASASYAVRTVSGGRQSALSLSTLGHRGAHLVTDIEIQVGTGAWLPVGNETTWTDLDAQSGSITVGAPFASTTFTDRVDVLVEDATISMGATRNYRVRALNTVGAGAESEVVDGHRDVGVPSYQWEWSATSDGVYAGIEGATSRTFSDMDVAPGELRWYRVIVDAEGATAATSDTVDGRRAAPAALGTYCSSSADCPTGTWCPTDTNARRCSPRTSVGGVEMAFQWVPGGMFTMGSPSNEVGRFSSREAQVTATLTRDYFVQRTPVTQEQWTAVIESWNELPSDQRTMSGWSGTTPIFGTTPACFRSESGPNCATTGSNPNRPVERVSWWDAVVFANALSILSGLTPCYTLNDCDSGPDVSRVGGGCSGTSTSCTIATFSCSTISFVGKACTGYRLPTEAEWERAARGDTTTATYGGNLSAASGCASLSGSSDIAAGTPLSDLAWYGCTSGGHTRPVGRKLPNVWGLYDMLGSVHEWTWTRYAAAHSGGTDPVGPLTGSLRVLRGASWSSEPRDARAANRETSGASHRSRNRGFRLVRSAPVDDHVDCGSLTAPTNGYVSVASTVFQAVATYTCRADYVMVGEPVRTCLARGEWSGEPPICDSLD